MNLHSDVRDTPSNRLPPDQWCLTVVLESPEDACPRAKAVRALGLGGIDLERHAADVTRCFSELAKANSALGIFLESVDPNFDHLPGVHRRMINVIENLDATAVPYPMCTFQKLFFQLPSQTADRYTKTGFYVMWREESTTTTVKWKPMFSEVQVKARKPLVAMYSLITKVVLLLVEVAQLNYKIGRFYTGLGFAWTALIFTTNLLKNHLGEFDPFLILQHAVSSVVLTALTVLMTEAHSECRCHQLVSIVARSCLRMFETCLCRVEYDSLELEISSPSLGEIFHSLVETENSYNETNRLTSRQMAVCAIFCEMRRNDLMQYVLEDGKEDKEADREMKVFTTDRRELSLGAVLAVNDPYMTAAINYVLSCNLYIESSFLSDFLELQRLESIAVMGLDVCLRCAQPLMESNKEFAELASLATVLLQTDALRNCVRTFHAQTKEGKLQGLDCLHAERLAAPTNGELSEHAKDIIVFLVTFVHIYLSDHVHELMSKANIQDRRLLKKSLNEAFKSAIRLIKSHPSCYTFCQEFLFDVVDSWKISGGDTRRTTMEKTLALIRGFALLARLSARTCEEEDEEDSEDEDAKDGESKEGKDVGGEEGKDGEGGKGKDGEGENRRDREGEEERDGEVEEKCDEGKEECDGRGEDGCDREGVEDGDRGSGDEIDRGQRGIEATPAMRLIGGDERDEAEDSNDDGKYGKNTINRMEHGKVESFMKIGGMTPQVYGKSRNDSATHVNSLCSKLNPTNAAGLMASGTRNLYGPCKNAMTVKNVAIKTAAAAANDAADQIAFVAKWVAEQSVLEKLTVGLVTEKMGTKIKAGNEIPTKRVADLKASAAIFSAAIFSAESLSDANLSATNLSATNFSAANLAAVNLSAANFSVANFSVANFAAENFSAANLSTANFSAVNLSAVNLSAVNLSAVNLSAVNLSAVNLSAVNLSAVNLSAANFSAANFSAAKLSAVNLSTTNLSVANFLDVELSSSKSIKERDATDQQVEAAADQRREASNVLNLNSCPEDYNYFCEYHFDVNYLKQENDLASSLNHLFDVARSLDIIAKRLPEVKFFRGKFSWPSTKSKAEACLKDLLHNETTGPDSQPPWVHGSTSDLYDGHRKLDNTDNLKTALQILQDHKEDGPGLIDSIIHVSEVLGLQTTGNS